MFVSRFIPKKSVPRRYIDRLWRGLKLRPISVGISHRPFPFAVGCKPPCVTPSQTERLLVLALAPHVRAPAQELLDLLLVRVGGLGAAHDGVQPQVLAELEHGLARRVLVAE